MFWGSAGKQASANVKQMSNYSPAETEEMAPSLNKGEQRQTDGVSEEKAAQSFNAQHGG